MILDAAIVAFVGWFTWRGWRRGLLSSLTGFLGFVAATLVAVFGFRLLARPLQSIGLSAGVANLAGAVVLFVGVNVGAHLLGRTLTRALRWSKLGIVNSAGGGALAGAWAASWVALVLLAISVIPVPDAVASQLDRSTIGKGLVEEAPRWAVSIARTDLRRALTFFVAGERVSVVATDDFGRHDGAARQLWDLVNAERSAEGLATLRWTDELARAARDHAANMYRKGFFDHRSPNGNSPGDRMRARGATFVVAAENLALGPNTRTAHTQLMASAEHRAHILDPRFDRIGIGVMIGRQGLLIVQDFAG